MRPIQLKLQNFKSHADTTIDLAPVHVAAITGGNGAGKSTILDAIVYALYGADGLGLGKRADTVIREGTDTAQVTLGFLLGDQAYEVERTRKITGKSTLRFSRMGEMPGQWNDLTKGTIKDTQTALEDLIGCTAETFLQAVYVGQGDASRFAKATPAERKETLTQALDLDQYPPLQQQARERGRADTAQMAALEQRIQELQEANPEVAETACATLRSQLDELRSQGKALDEQIDTLREQLTEARAAAATRDQQARIVTEAANRVEDLAHRLNAAQEAARASAELADQLEALEQNRPPLTDTATLEKTEQHTADLVHEIRGRLATVLMREATLQSERETLERLQAIATTSAGALDGARRVVAKMRDDTDRCPTCNQALDQEARAAAIATLEASANQAEDALAAAERDVKAQAQRVDQLQAEYQDPEPLKAKLATAEQNLNDAQAALRAAHLQNEQHHQAGQQIERARQAVAARDAARATQDELEPQLQAAREQLDAERAKLPEFHQDTAQIEQQGRAVARQRAELTERAAATERQLGQAESLLEAARRSQEALRAAQQEQSCLKQQADVWETLTRAFGRDGIPAQVIRHARPQIEQDANEILTSMGAPYRIRLDLERENKSGTVSDTLDITILADGHERPFDLLSGGEQYRVNVALRFGIGRVLANRSGNRIETLVLDEPEGLDAGGFSALADLIRTLGQEFGLVLTVSHTDGLEAACDTQIRVEKTDAGSKVEVTA